MADDLIAHLRDGRQCGLRRHGDAGAPVLLLLHGTPGSRLVSDQIVDPITDAGLQLVTLDRPGYGQSSPDYPRSFARFAEDVGELAEQGGWGRFAVAGVSGGGAHALALGRYLAGQLAACVVLAGAVPVVGPPPPGPNRLPIRVMRVSPTRFRGLSHLMTAGAIRALRDPARTDKMLDRMLAKLPEADRQRLAKPGAREGLVANLREAFAQGGRATAEESLLVGGDWGFEGSEITATVHWWHGEDDRNVSAEAARAFAGDLPQAHWHGVAGGHAAWMDHLDAIIEQTKEALTCH